MVDKELERFHKTIECLLKNTLTISCVKFQGTPCLPLPTPMQTNW